MSLEIKKYINDNVYGGIGLTEKEFSLINTRIFQRLRRIKQQGLINYTFPSAEHTRFSHSLGVLYIMGKITDHLFQIGKITDNDRKILRYAALLHDVGHYPLSHITESVYRHREEYNRDKSVLEFVEEVKNPFEIFSEKLNTEKGHHELLGAEIVKCNSEIVDILKSDSVNPLTIGLIIQGKTDNVIYHQLMHSSLDADRLDYLLRDSMATGVKYGLIDLEYLIRLMTVGPFQYLEKKKIKTVNAVGINFKGVHALEHYLMARYFSYSQVTLHRTSSEYEILAKIFINKLADDKRIYSSYNDIINILKNSPEEFIEFDDTYMWKAINSIKKEGFDQDYELYIRTLTERGKIYNIYDEKEIVSIDIEGAESKINKLKNAFQNEQFLTKIREKFQLSQYGIGYVEQFLGVEFSKKELSHDNENKIVEAAKIIDSGGACKQLSEFGGSLIKEIFDKKLRTFRIFCVSKIPINKGELRAYITKNI